MKYPLVLLGIFFPFTLWSWRKTPDVLIDFGLELYIPWQISCGKILFKDIAYFNGPLSPYLNALVFSLFGDSLTVLMLFNTGIAALLAVILYLFFQRACDSFTAFFTIVIFLFFFAFAHFTEVGNYNWIAPYSHDLTHGITLSCIMLLLFQKCVMRFRWSLVALAGICLGSILLTKMEVTLAAAGAAVIGLAFVSRVHGLGTAKGLMLVSLFLAATLIPLAIYFLAFGAYMPFLDNLHHLFRGWEIIFEGKVAQNKFYLLSTGLLNPQQNLGMIGWALLDLFVLFLAAMAYDRYVSSPGRKRWVFFALFLVFMGSTLLEKRELPWLVVGKSLPLVSLIGAIFLVTMVYKNNVDPNFRARIVSMILWVTFALLLLAKIILAPRVYHYGFALAMPAGTFVVAFFYG